MQQFEITLPQADNAGQGYATAHARFQGFLADTFGGFTFFEAQGAWHDDARKLYREAVTVYRVAIPRTLGRTSTLGANDRTYTHSAYVEILQTAKLLFPDQIAFYWAFTGHCEVSNAEDI